MSHSLGASEHYPGQEITGQDLKQAVDRLFDERFNPHEVYTQTFAGEEHEEIHPIMQRLDLLEDYDPRSIAPPSKIPDLAVTRTVRFIGEKTHRFEYTVDGRRLVFLPSGDVKEPRRAVAAEAGDNNLTPEEILDFYARLSNDRLQSVQNAMDRHIACLSRKKPTKLGGAITRLFKREAESED